MIKLFSKKLKNKTVFDNDSDSESDYEEDNGIKFGEILYEREILDKIPYKLIKTNARELVQKVESYCYNRSLNTEHINQIYTCLTANQNPFLMNTFKIVCDENNKRRVLDGNHRLEALIQILKEDQNMEWNLDIFVELFIVKDLEDNIVLDLYKLANKTLNVSFKDNPDIFLCQLIKRICKDPILNKGIIDRTSSKGVNRPKIAKKDLYDKFKELYILKDNNKSIPEIINKIKDLNHQISIINDEEVFGKNITQKCLNQREKANKLKFYLNMSGSKYTPEYWIPMILKS